MTTEHSIPLSQLTTMRLGGPAKNVITVTSVNELEAVLRELTPEDLMFVIGGGSNIIARDEGFDGTIILNRITGFEMIDADETSQTYRIGAGENWDETVAKLVGKELSGVEAMSAIPGTVGATPVQNVGAYGQEIADTLVSLEAYDLETRSIVTIQNEECGFSYRNSIFKDPATRHHIITSITLKLSKSPMHPPFYSSLETYLSAHDITDYSPASIRNAVIAIRKEKLPDPTVVANTGSFFKNPVVEKTVAERLQNQFHDLPGYPMSDGRVKLAAGWLVEHAGMKGHAAHGFTTFATNALVVVNDSADSYEALEAFKAELIGAVRDKFGIVLEQEPETL